MHCFKYSTEDIPYLQYFEKEVEGFFFRDSSGEVHLNYRAINRAVKSAKCVVVRFSLGNGHGCGRIVDKGQISNRAFKKLWIVQRFSSVPHLIPNYLVKDKDSRVRDTVASWFETMRFVIDRFREMDSNENPIKRGF